MVPAGKPERKPVARRPNSTSDPGGEGVGLAAEEDDRLTQKVAQYLADRFRAQTGVDVRLDAQAWAKVCRAAARARRELSRSPVCNVCLPFLARDAGEPLHLDVVISQRQLLELMMGEGR